MNTNVELKKQENTIYTLLNIIEEMVKSTQKECIYIKEVYTKCIQYLKMNPTARSTPPM